MSDRAIFIDRDGTLVEPRHYPSKPQDLILYSGICDELRILQSRGFKLVIITNQSGIARGYFSEADLGLMHDSLCQELERRGVSIDAIYYCPHHKDGIVEHLAVECDCRKPAPGMLLRAAREIDLDLKRSWFVGDILDDVEAGNRAGCRTVLVDLGTESLPRTPIRIPDFVSCDAVHALQIIQSAEGISHPDDVWRGYLPSTWTRAVADAQSDRLIGEAHASND